MSSEEREYEIREEILRDHSKMYGLYTRDGEVVAELFLPDAEETFDPDTGELLCKIASSERVDNLTAEPFEEFFMTLESLTAFLTFLARKGSLFTTFAQVGKSEMNLTAFLTFLERIERKGNG